VRQSIYKRGIWYSLSVYGALLVFAAIMVWVPNPLAFLVGGAAFVWRMFAVMLLRCPVCGRNVYCNGYTYMPVPYERYTRCGANLRARGVRRPPEDGGDAE